MLPRKSPPRGLQSWETSFPYTAGAREIQAQALDVLAREWENYDVFVVSAPTAFGKTAISETLMRCLGNVSTITPTNQLVEQYLEEFPECPTLSRLDSYHCATWDRPCSMTRGRMRGFCRRDTTPDRCECPASRDLRVAKFRKGPGIYNYHTYLAQSLHRDTLIVDEAHNLIPVIRDRLSLTIWRHDLRWPNYVQEGGRDEIRRWLETLPPGKRKGKKISILWDSVTYPKPQFVPHCTTGEFNGKGTIRGEPEERECIRLLPTDLRDAPPMFWPGLGRTYHPGDILQGKGGTQQVRKVVLLSATIGPKDVEQLGLSRHRTLYVDCTSPIPAEGRPIHLLGVTAVHRGNTRAAEELATAIESISSQHPGEKGIVHATYSLARDLRGLLCGNPRFLFHDSGSKGEVYRRFRESPPGEGRILVASGMYEGIDLPEDLGRFQMIAKVPWPYLGNPSVAHLAELDPEWYNWETVKTVIQACGRICRTPEDYGRTYILDSTMGRLLDEAGYMFPSWWRDALE